jgi:hypothetical protein
VSTWSLYVVVVFLVVGLTSIGVIGKRYDNGYYSLLMTKGGNPHSYTFTLFITNVFVNLFIMCIMEAMLYFGGVRMEGFWLAILLFIFTEPLFKLNIIYYNQYSKRKTVTTSTINYAVIMAIAYVIVILLYSFMYNQPTYQIGFLIGKIFCWIPVVGLV